MPRALAVNPLLTISMFTERAAEHLRRELRLPAYDAALEGDDRAPKPDNERRRDTGIPANDVEEAVVTVTNSSAVKGGRTEPSQPTGMDRSQIASPSCAPARRAIPRGVQEETWHWIKQLGAKARHQGARAAVRGRHAAARSLTGQRTGSS